MRRAKGVRRRSILGKRNSLQTVSWNKSDFFRYCNGAVGSEHSPAEVYKTTGAVPPTKQYWETREDYKQRKPKVYEKMPQECRQLTLDVSVVPKNCRPSDLERRAWYSKVLTISLRWPKPGMVAPAFNPNTKEAEGGGSLSSKPVWSIGQVPEPGLLNRKALSQKKQRYGRGECS